MNLTQAETNYYTMDQPAIHNPSFPSIQIPEDDMQRDIPDIDVAALRATRFFLGPLSFRQLIWLLILWILFLFPHPLSWPRRGLIHLLNRLLLLQLPYIPTLRRLRHSFIVSHHRRRDLNRFINDAQQLRILLDRDFVAIQMVLSGRLVDGARHGRPRLYMAGRGRGTILGLIMESYIRCIDYVSCCVLATWIVVLWASTVVLVGFVVFVCHFFGSGLVPGFGLAWVAARKSRKRASKGVLREVATLVSGEG
ncbi:hypothetical protein B0T20DRAFT_398568 [Sordaria brevicollis]|uniref:Uncharacterized protein n=1 Tax=Sordaria brevicollis TaxID=83679 RepID=A0AAE0PM36_SORBR|nr:hypothetical protein B0T20DRAFT_398568 [Sordaria brevicollis]